LINKKLNKKEALKMDIVTMFLIVKNDAKQSVAPSLLG